MRKTFALVSLSKLQRNYLKIKKYVYPARVMAVVKADAYGHGATEVSRYLSQLGADKPAYYAVSIFKEAKELRESGVAEPILLLEPLVDDLIYEAKNLDLTISLCALEQIEMLKKFSKDPKLAGLKIHLKIDTGMNRLGIRWDDAIPEIFSILEMNLYNWEGIYTHFATADSMDFEFTKLQLARFNSIIETCAAKGIIFKEVHTANSSAIFNHPNSYFTLVRPGIALYGYYPSQEIPEHLTLEPVMNVYSEIEIIKKMKSNEGLSYGLTYKAEGDIKIATLPIGYADGYNRALSDTAKVIIEGEYFNQIGRVSMDRIMINLKDKEILPGTRVLLMGEENHKRFDAWDWANICKTIPYEIICSFSKRLPRTYMWSIDE